MYSFAVYLSGFFLLSALTTNKLSAQTPSAPAEKSVAHADTTEDEEGPFGRALQKHDWQEVNKLMNKGARHGMAAKPGKNPIAATPESLSKGKAVFEEYCVICHGNGGKGDGEAAEHLIIKPANLQEVAKRFPDRMFFMQIATGKGDMPAWYDMLDTSEIWNVTNYVRTLGKK